MLFYSFHIKHVNYDIILQFKKMEANKSSVSCIIFGGKVLIFSAFDIITNSSQFWHFPNSFQNNSFQVFILHQLHSTTVVQVSYFQFMF